MARLLCLIGAALVQLAVWLVVRPDLAGPQWSEGRSVELWLVLEAVAAVLIGLIASDKALAVQAVLAGWGLQMLHFRLLGEHYDDTLAGLGLLWQVFFAVVARALTLLAYPLRRRARRRTASSDG